LAFSVEIGILVNLDLLNIYTNNMQYCSRVSTVRG